MYFRVFQFWFNKNAFLKFLVEILTKIGQSNFSRF